MQKTANEIKSSFELLASGHYQIHSFLYAQEFEQQAYENLIYPLMLVYPLGGSLSGTSYTRNYRVVIADRVLKSEGNELEVESDTQLIALDVLAYWMKLGTNERFSITSSNTITPFWEKWGDEVTGHFVDIGIEEFYDFNSCAIPLSSAIPSPTNPCKDARILINSVIYGNAPSDTNFNVVVKDQLGALVGSLIGGEWIVNTGGACADATYTIEDSLGNVLYTGTIPSGGSVTEVIGNSTLNVNKSDGTLISSRSILAEGTDSYNVGDSSAVLKDESGNVLSTTPIKATESKDIVAPNGDVSVNSVAFDDVLSGGTLDIEVLKSTGNDQIGSKQGQYWRIGDSTITNSDSSYDVDVKATESLFLPDSQINVNSVDSGDVVSVKTIDVNLEDSLGAPVVPTSVGLVGNTLTIEVPSSAPPSTGTYLVRFFDIDGTILKEERRNAGQDATAPTDPDYDPTYLTFAEWNQPFTNVQNDIDVGAIYDTIDGKSYLFLRITDTTGLQPTLQLNKSTTNLMTIDWGDATTNTTSTSGNVNITKTAAYPSIGNYVVTIEDSGTHGVNTGGYILGNNATYSRTLIKAYLGLTFITLGDSSMRILTSMSIISLSKNCGNLGFFSFQDSSALLAINIPNNITSISASSFSGCRSLKRAIITNNITTLNSNTFATCNSLVDFVFPNTITTLTGLIFSNCASLTKIKLPNSITSMGSAFTSCISLETINIPNNITSLTEGFFSGCSSLKEVVMSNAIITINNQSFLNCFTLQSLEFSNTLTTITAFGQNFANCTSLLEYTFLSTTPPTLGSTTAFSGINAACKIYVPDASVAAYKAATNWSTYANYIYPLSTKP
jgi:hypothetical protein